MLDRWQAAGHRAQAPDGGGDLLLGAVEHGQLGEGGAGQRLGHAARRVLREALVGDEGGDAGGDALARGLEQRGRVIAQVGLAQRGVALLLERIHREEDAGVEARRGVVGEAEVDGDAVGGLEADAVDLARHAIGLGLQDLARLAAVFVDQLHALAGRHAVGLEKDVEFAKGALLVPRLLDRGGAHLADAGDAAKFTRFLGEHAEGVGAEGVHDLVRVNLAHPGHEAGAEVFANAIHARR